MKIKLMYKIHCIGVSEGICRSAGNDTFYEHLEGEGGALEAAETYVRHPRHPNGGSMVIYKAFMLVREEQAPVEVMAIEHDGEVVPLCERSV